MLRLGRFCETRGRDNSLIAGEQFVRVSAVQLTRQLHGPIACRHTTLHYNIPDENMTLYMHAIGRLRC